MAKLGKKATLEALKTEIAKSKRYIAQLEDGLSRHTDERKKQKSRSSIEILKQQIARDSEMIKTIRRMK